MCSEKCNGYFATKCRVQTVADASITMPSGNVLSYKDSPLRYLIDQHRLGAIVSWALRQIRRKAFFDICVLYLVYLIWFHCMIRQWCGKPEGGNSNPDCRKLTLFLSWNRMETLFMKSCWKHEAVYYFVHVTECFDWLKLRLHTAINLADFRFRCMLSSEEQAEDWRYWAHTLLRWPFLILTCI